MATHSTSGKGEKPPPLTPYSTETCPFARTLQGSIRMEKRGFTGESIALPLTSLQTIGTQRVRWFARLAFYILTLMHPKLPFVFSYKKMYGL